MISQPPASRRRRRTAGKPLEDRALSPARFRVQVPRRGAGAGAADELGDHTDEDDTGAGPASRAADHAVAL